MLLSAVHHVQRPLASDVSLDWIKSPNLIVSIFVLLGRGPRIRSAPRTFNFLKRVGVATRFFFPANHFATVGLCFVKSRVNWPAEDSGKVRAWRMRSWRMGEIQLSQNSRVMSKNEI